MEKDFQQGTSSVKTTLRVKPYEAQLNIADFRATMYLATLPTVVGFFFFQLGNRKK